MSRLVPDSSVNYFLFVFV